MSGHSKWSTIKHKKGKEDARKGAIFSKLSKMITIAARYGGGNPDTNIKLANAIDKAKQANMSADKIDKAIKRGTGEIEGVVYEELVFEGYGPAGVAIMVNTATDNRRRTTSEIRHLFSKYNGNLGTGGSVSWLFESKGVILIPKENATEEQLLDAVLDYGVDDIRSENHHYEIICDPKSLNSIESVLQNANITYTSAGSTMFPKTTVKLQKKEASSLLRLVEALEEHEDVQEVYSNFNIPDEIMEEIASTV